MSRRFFCHICRGNVDGCSPLMFSASSFRPSPHPAPISAQKKLKSALFDVTHLGGVPVPQLQADPLLHVHVGARAKAQKRQQQRKTENKTRFTEARSRGGLPPPAATKRQLTLHVRSRPTSSDKPRPFLMNIHVYERAGFQLAQIYTTCSIQSTTRYYATFFYTIG